MWGRHTVIRRPILATGVVLMLVALSTCGWSQADEFINASTQPSPSTDTPSITPSNTSTKTRTAVPLTPTSTPPPSRTEAIHSLWLSPALPHELTVPIPPLEEWVAASDSEKADIRLEVGSDHIVSRFVYVLVAPFPAVLDDVDSTVLKNFWLGKGQGPLKGNPPLLTDGNTRDVLAAWWGVPADSSVHILPAAQLVDASWFSRPAWAIIPFDSIEPRWKVLSINGSSPLEKQFDPAVYALTVPISLNGNEALAAQAQSELNLPALNRDPQKLTTLVMTGTTALVRGTAALMKTNGIEYPAREIAPILRSADITHISNEIAFASHCPTPDPFSQSFFFCSDPANIGLLEFVGAKIVELTGNHVGDYGSQPLLDTIAAYTQRGWGTFGGGINFEDARKPLLIENHGNKLAFIGCNPVGPEYAWATDERPGAAPCDDVLSRHENTLNEYTSNYTYIENQIRSLRAKGYLPIVTLQYREYEYYQPEPMQQIVFHRMADAGAVIVSGSQAHHPQGMDFTVSSFIHYGLGNLFFDQIVLGSGFEYAFIDRHIFYDGKYLGVQLLTTRFEDQALSRPTTAGERRAFLSTVFCASGWTENCEGVTLPPTPTAE